LQNQNQQQQKQSIMTNITNRNINFISFVIVLFFSIIFKGTQSQHNNQIVSHSSDAWVSDLEGSYNAVKSTSESSSDAAVLAFDCDDSWFYSYYTNELNFGKNIDFNNKQHMKAYNKYLKRKSKESILKEYGLTYYDYRRERLKHLSISKQEELGLKLDDKSYDYKMDLIHSSSSCSSEESALYSDLSPTVDTYYDGSYTGNEAVTFGIGWEVTIVLYKYAEEAGVAIGLSDFGIYYAETGGFVLLSIGCAFYVQIGFFSDYNNIAGDSYEVSVGVDLEVVGFGMSYIFSDSGNLIGTSAAFEFGEGISLPITIEITGTETHVATLTSMSSKASWFMNNVNHYLGFNQDVTANGMNYQLLGIFIVCTLLLIGSIVYCGYCNRNNKDIKYNYQSIV
jgi:hypothetical protein